MKSLAVVIPTYCRGTLLLETVDNLLTQADPPDEIILVDQTQYVEGDVVASQLKKLDSFGAVIWILLDKPSITRAMNTGLQIATSNHVLFLDDDVRFNEDFIQNHRNAINKHNCPAHVGQVIQPWQSQIVLSDYHSEPGLEQDLAFSFHSNKSANIANCMAGNLCVDRTMAIEAGGFDEQFKGAAYRFETEFCRRLIRHADRYFYFEPQATLYHMHYPTGGTRAEANHLTSTSPNHSLGDYYFALLEGQGLERYRYIGRRFCRSVLSKFYLKKPWYLPFRVLAEIRGLIGAIACIIDGPKRIDNASDLTSSRDGNVNRSANKEGVGGGRL